MLAGIFHEGSGLGDQLFRYITVRTLAEKKGLDWGMVNGHSFKGDNFLKLDYGTPHPLGGMKAWNEKDVRENGNDIRSYDPEINFVEDNTIIDGSFEDDKYWGFNLENINKWLQVESPTEEAQMNEEICVVGFRGGEYSLYPDVFLSKDYWDKAESIMRSRGVTWFQVHTDDPTLARQLFPHWEVVPNEAISHSKHSNMGINWRAIRFAKNAIIANSAFYILPRKLRHHDGDSFTIAPRYWAGRNTKVWKRPACYYPEFTYV